MSLRPNSRTEVRKKSYKTGVDADEARRRREDNLVEIRKNKREDNLLKKRREGSNLHQSQQLSDGSQNPIAIEKRVRALLVPDWNIAQFSWFLCWSWFDGFFLFGWVCLIGLGMWELGVNFCDLCFVFFDFFCVCWVGCVWLLWECGNWVWIFVIWVFGFLVLGGVGLIALGMWRFGGISVVCVFEFLMLEWGVFDCFENEGNRE